MTVILMLSMIVTFLALEGFVQRSRARRSAAGEALPAGPPAGFLLAPNHTWVKEEKEGVLVGVDEFIARIVGAASSVMLPDAGATVSPGSPSFALARGGRHIRFASPVQGRVLEVNRRLVDNPALARMDPYGGGWLLRIAPDRRRSAMPALTGERARAWLAGQLASAREFLTAAAHGALSPSLPDGGELVEGALMHCDAAVWREFERRFTSIGAAMPADGE
ncbi:MAG TPA: glycine cleavage system protein H [Bacteroidota bacterium]|nr:glycine cleavage system protein H [Bacteroidota bacterium]